MPLGSLTQLDAAVAPAPVKCKIAPASPTANTSWPSALAQTARITVVVGGLVSTHTDGAGDVASPAKNFKQVPSWQNCPAGHVACSAGISTPVDETANAVPLSQATDLTSGGV